jgi:FMN-dependent NADH-azoreductase
MRTEARLGLAVGTVISPVITSRGASYEKGTAREAFDFQEPYLLHILAVIGLTDVTFIHAENQGREEAALCFAAAAERISEIAIDQDQLVASPAQFWRAGSDPAVEPKV